MVNEIRARIKSREEIMNTLENIDIISGETYGFLISDKYKKLKRDKVGQLSIPDWLWTLCNKDIVIKDSKTQSHQYDYYYFDYPSKEMCSSTTHIVYFMEEWIEPIEDNAPKQLNLFV